MKIVNVYSKENPIINEDSSPKTEKAVYITFKKKGFKENEHFEKQKDIDNIPFCKRKKHKVDLILNNKEGEKLYVEIKGHMTYLEVNKLRYLLEKTPYNFYILQLTEIDWIIPYEKSEFKFKTLKSKYDFEKQMGELVKFIEGTIAGNELSEISKKRLKDYINYRRKDLKRWKVEADHMANNR